MTSPAATQHPPKNHVIVVPYPGRGHINPLLIVCRQVASRCTRNTHFTFVLTEEWLGLIGDATILPPNIRFATIPNVVPSELVRANDMETFVAAVQTKMEEPVEQLLNQLEPPVDFIIADTFLQWAVLLGNRRNIPVASFWSMSASMFSVFYNFDLLVKNKDFPVHLPEGRNKIVDYIPGLSPMRITDLPTIILEKTGKKLDRALDSVSLVSRAQYLLIVTIYEIESKVIDELRAKLPVHIYSSGPNIPYFRFDDSPAVSDIPSYFTWLDSKPSRKVLYVSFGSYLSVSSAQMDEFAAGLKDSGVPFLWVAREEAARLSEICGGAGVVVPWCDQLRVLCHPSVGGFFSHCGWSSVMESIYGGVPLITSPILMDQTLNRKAIVEDWKIGCKLKDEIGTEMWVKREEISELVKKFMDSESIERKDMIKRVQELQEISRGGVEKGGSSYTNLDAFVKDAFSVM